MALVLDWSVHFPLQRGTDKYHGSEEPSSKPGQFHGVAWFKEQFPETTLEVEDVTFSFYQFMISDLWGLRLFASS